MDRDPVVWAQWMRVEEAMRSASLSCERKHLLFMALQIRTVEQTRITCQRLRQYLPDGSSAGKGKWVPEQLNLKDNLAMSGTSSEEQQQQQLGDPLALSGTSSHSSEILVPPASETQSKTHDQ